MFVNVCVSVDMGTYIRRSFHRKSMEQTLICFDKKFFFYNVSYEFFFFSSPFSWKVFCPESFEKFVDDFGPGKVLLMLHLCMCAKFSSLYEM